MLGATRAALLGASVAPSPAATPALLGRWSMSETTGAVAADAIAGNDATITVPSWTVATHEWQRRSLLATETTAGYDATHTKVGGGGVGSLEISNGGPAIPMVSEYQLSAVSFVIYVCPLSEQRGQQYWDASNYRYGSEVIAGAFGSSPGAGHWSLDRKYTAGIWQAPGSRSWHYGLSVHTGSQWVSIGYSGAAAEAPPDVAKRIVVTFGPAGTQLWIDDTLIDTAAYAGGWQTLAEPITLGCDPAFDHANDRRPFWGRVDEVEVRSGQFEQVAVQALPVATSSLLWKYPADFDDTTAIDLADESTVQDAIAAAATAGVYVWQEETDTTEYGDAYGAAGNNNSNKMVSGCKGFVGCRFTRPANPGTIGNYDRWFEFGTWNSGAGGLLSGNYAGRIVGCTFDANAVASGYRIDQVPAPNGNDIQQAHILRFKTHDGVTCAVEIDACTFQDATSDAVSCYRGSRITVKSSRFRAIFRGALVQNENNVHLTAYRCELDSFGPNDRNGCGYDVEPFGQSELNIWRFYDVWMDSDFDDHGEISSSVYEYINTHCYAASFNLAPSGTYNDEPVLTWAARYSTIAYHHHYGNFPPSWMKGMATLENSGNTGCLFDNCVFLASGVPYRFHEFGIRTPDASTLFEIFLQRSSGWPFGNDGLRLLTLRDCQLRGKALPDGIPASLVTFLRVQAMTTTQSIELDGLTIGAEFADLPFRLGGITVRHRNVLHERTGSTTPWTEEGEVVAL